MTFGTIVELPKTEPVEITVAAASVSGKVDFRPEIRLLRAALLYGDHVTLFSLFSDVIEKGQAISELDEEGLIELTLRDCAKNDPVAYPRVEAKLRGYQRLKRKRGKTRQEVLEVAKMAEDLKRLGRRMKANAAKIQDEVGATTLKDLISTGLVTVRTVDSGTPWETNSSAVLEYLEAVSRHLATGRSYPLLDETVSALVARQAEAGDVVLIEGTADRSKRVALAANLFFRLPLLESLSAKDVLSIRKELQAPLLRFRAAMIQMARDVQSEPWSTSFASEAQTVYESKVVPALIDIGEAVEANSWLSEFLSAVAGKPMVIPAASGVGLLIANSSAVPSLLVQALTLFAGGSLVANEAVRKWREKQDAIRRNQIFYYWKLSQT